MKAKKHWWSDWYFTKSVPLSTYARMPQFMVICPPNHFIITTKLRNSKRLKIKVKVTNDSLPHDCTISCRHVNSRQNWRFFVQPFLSNYKRIKFRQFDLERQCQGQRRSGYSSTTLSASGICKCTTKSMLRSLKLFLIIW